MVGLQVRVIWLSVLALRVPAASLTSEACMSPHLDHPRSGIPRESEDLKARRPDYQGQ